MPTAQPICFLLRLLRKRMAGKKKFLDGDKISFFIKLFINRSFFEKRIVLTIAYKKQTAEHVTTSFRFEFDHMVSQGSMLPSKMNLVRLEFIPLLFVFNLESLEQAQLWGADGW